MSGDDRSLAVRRWLQYAGEDLALAERILERQEDAPRLACFLAQQAAEKALKAALTFCAVDFPKTHDLDRLRNMLPGDWSLRREHTDLAQLADWAVDARYPDGIADPSWDDANDAVTQARAALASVSADLKTAGLGGAR